MSRRTPHSRAKLISIAVLALALATVGYVRFHGRPKATASDSTSKPASQNGGSAKSAVSITHADAGLQQTIDAWAAQHSFDSTISVTELAGQKRIAVRNASTLMTTASTYKVFVAYATLHQVEQGIITMQTATRTGQTVSQALSKMILQSDNDSAEALGFLIGWDKIDALAARAGAIHTDINNYDSAGNATNGNKQSTAADLSTMLVSLQDGKLLNSSNTQLLLGLMKTQVWRERVPAGVPSGVAVADKPGWLSNVQNDAAIVYGPKSTYVLVVMTNGSTTQPLADLSRLVYAHLEQ